MATERTRSGADPGHTPDWELPKHDAITEANWAEYEAQGFVPVPERLSGAQNHYGAENVYTGDEWDADAGRPLRHKPGKTVYVNPAGLKHGEEMTARIIRSMREPGYSPPSDDPATS